MNSKLVFFVCALSSVLACGPQTGKTYTKATFNIKVLPPVTWTTIATGGTVFPGDPKQAADKDAATKQADDDVKTAIADTVKEFSLSNDTVNSTLTYDVLESLKMDVACPNPATAQSFRVYDGTVYYDCGDSTNNVKLSMAERNGSVAIVSTTALNEQSWRILGVKVQQKLEAKKVIFQGNLEIVFT